MTQSFNSEMSHCGRGNDPLEDTASERTFGKDGQNVSGRGNDPLEDTASLTRLDGRRRYS